MPERTSPGRSRAFGWLFGGMALLFIAIGAVMAWNQASRLATWVATARS